jgi:hypothetical protein
MPYTIRTKDGIVIPDVPDDMPQDHPQLKARVAALRAERAQSQPDLEAAPRKNGYIDNMARRIASGATMGFADEFAAKMGAITGIGGTKGDYAGNLAKQRETDKAFFDESPVSATAAEIGGALLSPANKAVMAAAPFNPATVGRFGNFALQGGLAGAASGAGNSTEGNRLQGGTDGAMLGAAFGAAVPGGLELAAKGFRAASTPFMSAPTNASRQLMRAMQRDGLNIDEAKTRLSELGPESVIADLGDNVLGLGEAVAQQPGKSLKAAGALRGRQLEQGDRITKAALDSVGAQSIDDLIAQRSAAARPLYEAAFSSTKPLNTPTIDRLVKNPLLQEGMKRGLSIIRNESDSSGLPMRLQDYGVTGFNAAGDPILGGVPTLRLLDAAKRGLDTILEAGDKSIRNQTTNKLTQYGRSVEQLRNTLVKELDEVTKGDDGVSLYKKAREAWAGPSDVIEVLSNITNKVERSRDATDVTGALFGSRASRKEIRKLMGSDEAYEAFAKAIQNESTMANTNRAVSGNSRTQFRNAAQADLEGGQGIDLMFDLANAPTAPGGLMRGARALVKSMTGPSARVADELAPMFSNDPAIKAQTLADLQNRISMYQAFVNSTGFNPGQSLVKQSARIGGYGGGLVGGSNQ